MICRRAVEPEQVERMSNTSDTKRLAEAVANIATTITEIIESKIRELSAVAKAAGTVHGGINSDFPMTLSGRWGPRHASGTIGNGGRDLRASSVNGSIELRSQ